MSAVPLDRNCLAKTSASVLFCSEIPKQVDLQAVLCLNLQMHDRSSLDSIAIERAELVFNTRGALLSVLLALLLLLLPLLLFYENLLEKENQRAELTVQGIPILLQA